MQKFKKILLAIGWILSYIFPLRVKFFWENVITIIRSGYYRRRFKFFPISSRIGLGFCGKGLEYISIGEKVVIDKFVELTAWDNNCCPEIIIGDGASIRRYSHITATNSIRIGKNFLAGPNVLITDNAHGYLTKELQNVPPVKRPLHSKGPIIIGDNVWVGEKASIMPGVTIGDNVIIGANSVVTKDIPDNCLAVGMPAKIIRQLD